MINVMQQIKNVFDPNGILNPYKVLPQQWMDNERDWDKMISKQSHTAERFKEINRINGDQKALVMKSNVGSWADDEWNRVKQVARI